MKLKTFIAQLTELQKQYGDNIPVKMADYESVVLPQVLDEVCIITDRIDQNEVIHQSIECDVKDCHTEVGFFIPVGGESTIYLCDEHNPNDSFSNGVYNAEIGIYSCNENCQICNS